jgi:hypothetical protein
MTVFNRLNTCCIDASVIEITILKDTGPPYETESYKLR